MGSRKGRQGGSRRAAAAPKAEAPAPEVTEMIVTALPPARDRRAVTGLLLRFISCGVLALAVGVLWRITLAPSALGPGAAFAGILSLLLGFIAGGIGWYVRDVRRRRDDPTAVTDERLVFSFVVFAAVPFAVLLLIGLVWLVALLIGAA